MRSRIWKSAALWVVVLVACTRQETSTSEQPVPVTVGDTAPAFSLSSAQGGAVSLSDFVGKPVLLYFSMGPG